MSEGQTMYDGAEAEVGSVKSDGERVPDVYGLMIKVQLALAEMGIGKTRTNQQQNYKFRGIDDAYNAASPIMAKHGLLMIPRMLKRETSERLSKGNSALFGVVVEAEYTFVAASDGSTVTAGPFYGESMDSGDKATNKAMSAAHKYAIFETFCVPVEGTPDADNDAHEVHPQLTPEQAAAFAMLNKAAGEGTKSLERAWGKGLTKEMRVALAATLPALKEEAAMVDAERGTQADSSGGGDAA